MASTINWPEPSSLPQPRAARNEERVVIRVVVEPQSTDIGGYLAHHGEGFFCVYGSDLPALQAMVQTDKHRALLATAREMFDELFAEHLKSCGGATAKNQTQKEAAHALAMSTMGESVESLFVKLPGGKAGRPPLLSLEIGPSTAAPYTHEAAAAQQAKSMADAFADALRQLIPQQSRKGA